MLEYKLEYAENSAINAIYRWDKFIHSLTRICTKLLGIKYTAFETCPEKMTLDIETQAIKATLLTQTEVLKDSDVSFASGMSFNANDYRFGGWSGFEIDSLGKIVAVSDEGFALKAEPKLNQMGQIIGFDNAIFSSLRDQNGAVLQGKNATDAEDITNLPNGQLAVSFERDHRILVFNDILEPAVDSIALPQDMLDAFEQFSKAFKETGNRQYGNVGLEAITVLNGHLIAAIEEPLPGELEHRVYMQNDMGGWDNLYYQGLSGYGISSATTLPNGNILFLERSTEYFNSYEHYGIRVVELDQKDFFAGNHLVGKTWMQFEPTTGDNFESIFCYTGKDGATYIGLATDDNYAYSERNILLNFELEDGLISGHAPLVELSHLQNHVEAPMFY